MKIGMFYHDNEVDEARHAKEVFLNELSVWEVNYEVKGQSIHIGEDKVIFKQIKEEKELRTAYDHLFVTKEVEKTFKTKMKNLTYHAIPYPTQAIVDLVLLVRS